MDKVYIVTYGTYSDYSICAVFSSIDKAKDYLQQNGSEYRIEEYDIDRPIENSKFWRVNMRVRDHHVHSCEATDEHSMIDCFHVYRDCYDTTDGGSITMYFRADSMDRAIKIANERLAQIIANKEIFYKKAFEKVRSEFWKTLSYPWVDYNTGEFVKL